MNTKAASARASTRHQKRGIDPERGADRLGQKGYGRTVEISHTAHRRIADTWKPKYRPEDGGLSQRDVWIRVSGNDIEAQF
jgi:hypothetical protein